LLLFPHFMNPFLRTNLLRQTKIFACYKCSCTARNFKEFSKKSGLAFQQKFFWCKISKWWTLNLIYKYKTDCLYVPMSLFHVPTAGPTSTKFCTDLHINSGVGVSFYKYNPVVPKTPKPKLITGEKTLLYKKCIKFFRAVPGPGRLVQNI